MKDGRITSTRTLRSLYVWFDHDRFLLVCNCYITNLTMFGSNYLKN